MPDIDGRWERAAEQRADDRADAVRQQDLPEAIIVTRGGSALHVVHALGEVVDAEWHGSDEQRPDVADRLGEVG